MKQMTIREALDILRVEKAIADVNIKLGTAERHTMDFSAACNIIIQVLE